MAGVLILEDGTCFPGNVFGYRDKAKGRLLLIWDIGYQEILLIPLIMDRLCVAYPLIGNYGINPNDNQG